MNVRLFGWGLAGVLGAVGPAAAQFAADRGVPPPAGVAPGGFVPDAAPPAAGPHPLAVRPELGPYVICVKSYAGEGAAKLAEELIQELRAKHNAPAYLFERGGDARRAEEARQQAVRDAEMKRNAPFLQVRAEMKKKAEAEGREFVDAPPTIRVPKVKYPEEYAVVIGGFKDMDAASGYLKRLRALPPLTDKPHLLDGAAVAIPGDKKGDKASVEGRYLSVYAQSMVVRNPALGSAAADAGPALDVDKNGVPLLKIWNDPEPYSLLKADGAVTLLVKTFSMPGRSQPANADAGVLGKLFGPGPNVELMDATAKQAHELAKALRSQKMAESLKLMGLPAVPLDAYVLHAKTGSLVTVGAFASADDPELIRTKQVLEAISFKVSDQPGGPAIRTERMFQGVYPIGIPKLPGGR